MYSMWGGYRPRHYHYRRGGLMFLPFLPLMILPVILVIVVFALVIKFLFPLLLIGAGIWFFTRHSRSYRRDWSMPRHEWNDGYEDKRKNDELVSDEKPKNEDADKRYVQTADGNWVEII